MVPPFRPLVSSSTEGSSALDGMFISLHGFLTDMWGSHRGAAHSIAARAAAADSVDALSASAAKLNLRFDKFLTFAVVAVMIQLIIVFAIYLILVSISKRRKTMIMRPAACRLTHVG